MATMIRRIRRISPKLVFDDRLNPELLQAFRDNPYTQRLDVY